MVNFLVYFLCILSGKSLVDYALKSYFYPRSITVLKMIFKRIKPRNLNSLGREPLTRIINFTYLICAWYNNTPTHTGNLALRGNVRGCDFKIQRQGKIYHEVGMKIVALRSKFQRSFQASLQPVASIFVQHLFCNACIQLPYTVLAIPPSSPVIVYSNKPQFFRVSGKERLFLQPNCLRGGDGRVSASKVRALSQSYSFPWSRASSLLLFGRNLKWQLYMVPGRLHLTRLEGSHFDWCCRTSKQVWSQGPFI